MSLNFNCRIILASASPRRKELLQYITDQFEIIPAGIDEGVHPAGLSAEELPAFLSRKKAEALARQNPDALIIGCDTAVLIGGHLLGKPCDEKDAFQMLRLLSGTSHTAITGCCLCKSGRTRVFSEQTKVVFYPLSDAEICAYIATGEPFDKAGAYGIQGVGCCLIKEIHGCYNNVVGLPVARLKRELQTFCCMEGAVVAPE